MIAICFIVGIVFGQVKNTTPYTDTCWISETLDSAVIYYGKAFVMADAQPEKVMICKVDDTTAAGFASDSIQFDWGYQLGYLTMDSANLEDTLWTKEFFFLDSMSTANFGAADVEGYVRSSDMVAVIDSLSGQADTTDVDGYASQARPFSLLKWAHFIRPWVRGLGKNQLKGEELRLNMHLIQKYYNHTRIR